MENTYHTTFLPYVEVAPVFHPKVLGIDVSRHQGTMNWEVAMDRGANFAYIRCTVGDYYTDPEFSRNWQECKRLGIPVSPYFVPCFDKNDSGQVITGTMITDRFFGVLGDRLPDFPVIVDLEMLMVRGIYEYRYVNKIAREVMTNLHSDNRMTVSSPWVYTNENFGNQYLTEDYWLDYPLVVASYPKVPYPIKWDWEPTGIPGVWDEYVCHQFSADGNRAGKEFGAGGSHAIDLNKMDGKVFAAFSGKPEPEPLPEPEPNPDYQSITIRGYDLEIIDYNVR